MPGGGGGGGGVGGGGMLKFRVDRRIIINFLAYIILSHRQEISGTLID